MYFLFLSYKIRIIILTYLSTINFQGAFGRRWIKYYDFMGEWTFLLFNNPPATELPSALEDGRGGEERMKTTD